MSKTKIMIVEDEFIVAKDIKNCLEHLGYAVCAQAASGEDAIEKVIEGKPDLILAFHNDIENSVGTKNMVKQSKKRGIKVIIIKE